MNLSVISIVTITLVTLSSSAQTKDKDHETGMDPFNSDQVVVEQISLLDQELLAKFGDDCRIYNDDCGGLLVNNCGLKYVVSPQEKFYVYVDSDNNFQRIKPDQSGISIINKLISNNAVCAPQSPRDLWLLVRLIKKLYMPSSGEFGDQNVWFLLNAHPDEWLVGDRDEFARFKSFFFLPRFTLVTDWGWELNFLYYKADGALQTWTVSGELEKNTATLNIINIHIENIVDSGSFIFPKWD